MIDIRRLVKKESNKLLIRKIVYQLIFNTFDQDLGVNELYVMELMVVVYKYTNYFSKYTFVKKQKYIFTAYMM